MRERDRRLAWERFWRGFRACAWWIATHSIAFASGAGVMYLALDIQPPEKVVLEHVMRYQPAQEIRVWQCTKNEFTEYRRACASRERMGKVKPKE